jgi:hypothetical protein
VRYLVALDDVGSVDGQLLVRIDGDEHLSDVCLHDPTQTCNATNDNEVIRTCASGRREEEKKREERKRVVREKQATHVDEVGVVA